MRTMAYCNPKEWQVYVSLDEELLFKSAKWDIDAAGRMHSGNSQVCLKRIRQYR
jgi:hypothetical protein